LGFAFNINTAKNNFNEFSLMISDQMDDNELKNLNIGYNAKNNTMFIINNNMNNNINNNINNNLTNSYLNIKTEEVYDPNFVLQNNNNYRMVTG
jgi:hypothetical protein